MCRLDCAALWFSEIQVLCDMEYGKQFILSPWSNKYHPPLEDGSLPSLELRKLEVEANDIFAIYRDQYHEGSISSVYMWEDDNEGFVGCFLIKKDGSKTGQGRQGYLQEKAWDAIHVIEVNSTRHGANNEGHICNMGRMIEEMESKLRNSLDQVYFGKMKEMVCTLRSPSEVVTRLPDS
ncbi:hypothetical protein DVH24_037661 [Malus domestica]|uniref:F-actin-capping protein subunit beta n=1 Tax=Malus domestica TaxID=3750 RepID=A0A498IY40_MALDO|nr:hypothetical protein DVH24_037661 [Malus domestica]